MYFGYMGWVDLSMIYVNETYLMATLIGGVIMGAGFITGGFCPGTSICAVAIGKIDAMVFTGGMFIGILLFSAFFPMLEGIYYGYELGPLKVYDVLNLSAGVFLTLLIVVAILAFLVTTWIQNRTKKVDY
jgi:hypothetical protein